MKKLSTLLLILSLLNVLDTKAQITGITPNQGQMGNTILNTTITTNGLFIVTATPSGTMNEAYLYKGSSKINIYKAASPGYAQCNVTHPDTARINTYKIPSNAPTGIYNLVVKTQGINNATVVSQDTLVSAFTVLPPDGYLSGIIYEDINRNKVKDPNEPGLPNTSVNAGAAGYYYLDSTGQFNLGVPNGNYQVSGYSGPNGILYMTTDSAYYNVSLNNNNISGLDFGYRRGLTTLAPNSSIPGRTVNFTLTSDHLFSNSLLISPGFYMGSNLLQNMTNKVVVDSNTFTFSCTIPPTAVPGVYYLDVYINYNSHILPACFTVLPYDYYLQGNVYFDFNGNGFHDTLEPGLPNERISIFPDSGYAFTNSNGDFSFGVMNGNHIVTWIPSSGVYQLSSDSASFTVNNTTTVTGLDFGLKTSNPDYACDVSLTGNLPRCNTNVTYTIKYMNQSNIVFNGRVYLIKDPIVTYSSASVTPTGFSGDTIYWDVVNIPQFVQRTITVVLSLPQSGTIITTAYFVSFNSSGQLQLTDAQSINQLIRCSFDPNDKSANPEGIGADHLTMIGDWIEYLVRFQNTGTDTAINVTVHDHLSGDLDLSTFEVLGSSHSMTTELKQDGKAIFTFANIMLPDSTVDEANSHGFLKYRVKSKATTHEMTVLENTAFIVFDSNAPVITNTTSNMLTTIIPVGVSQLMKSSGKAFVYPNPFNSTARLLFQNENHTPVNIEIRSITNNLLMRGKTSDEEYILNKQNLSSGIYFFKISSNDGKINYAGKFIID